LQGWTSGEEELEDGQKAAWRACSKNDRSEGANPAGLSRKHPFCRLYRYPFTASRENMAAHLLSIFACSCRAWRVNVGRALGYRVCWGGGARSLSPSTL